MLVSCQTANMLQIRLAGIWESESITLICFYSFPKCFTKPLIKKPGLAEKQMSVVSNEYQLPSYLPFSGSF